MTTTQPSLDAVCVCGHYMSEHKLEVGCCHVNEFRQYNPNFCKCVVYDASPSPAHDVPAAQLRERLARAEETIKQMSAELTVTGVELDKARAEADSLREQVAALQPLADGYAGVLAELTPLRNFVAAYDAWVEDDNTVWGNKFGELVLARENLQPSPRPDAQA